MTLPGPDPALAAPDLISIGAQSIVENAKRLGLTWTLTLATVTSTDPIEAIVDGDTVAIGMTSMIGPVTIDQRIYVIQVPPSGNFIVGNTIGGPPQYFRQVVTAADVADVTFSDIPGNLTRLEVYWRAQMSLGGAVSQRLEVNGVSGVNYSSISTSQNAATIFAEQLGSTAFYIGVCGSATSNHFGAGVGNIWFNDWNQWTNGSTLHCTMTNGANSAGGTNYLRWIMGNYDASPTVPRTQLRFFMDAGANISAGALYRLEGYF